MYFVMLVFFMVFIGAQSYPFDIHLPKCSAAQEQAVHKCGGDVLLGWMSSKLGLSPALVNNVYLDNNGLDTVDDLCLLYTKYEACIINFGMRLNCTSRLDMILVHLPYSYICGPGLKDARESMQCIWHANVDGSITKQFTMGQCWEAEMNMLSAMQKLFGVMNDFNIGNLEKQVFGNFWCKVMMMSEECYEPAYMRVCGMAAKRFVHGMFGTYEKFMQDLDVHGGPIHCATTEPSKLPLKLPPRNSSSIFKTMLVAMKKEEKEVRGLLGTCSRLDTVMVGMICIVDSLSDITGEGFLPKDPMELVESLLCKSHGIAKFQRCISSKKSCPRNIMSDLGSMIDLTCDFYSAIQKEKERGCYIPTTISLDLKTMCGYDWLEFIRTCQSVGFSTDFKRDLNQYQLLVKPMTCMFEQSHKFLIQHLPAACSDAVRTKLKNMLDLIKIIPDDFRDLISYVQKFLAQFSALTE